MSFKNTSTSVTEGKTQGKLSLGADIHRRVSRVSGALLSAAIPTCPMQSVRNVTKFQVSGPPKDK